MQATAVAHPNVALIKYWGKRDATANLPAVGSLSLTLAGLHTRTVLSFDASLAADQLWVNGALDAAASARAARCLDILRERAGVSSHALIRSSNDFPTGAGLASSASGFAALVCAAAAALGIERSDPLLDEVARLGSGSAPRSLHDGIVLLDIDDSAGVVCRSISAPDDWPLHVVVGVTSRAAKPVGSTGGMESSRLTSPYYQPWVDSHPADLRAALDAVAKRDFEQLADLSEYSCLKMHAVALSSRPGLIYWSGATVDCMQRIRELRAAGVPVFFTVDAGPQVKAVCLPDAAPAVAAALRSVPGVLETLDSPLGFGARAD